MHLLHTIHTTSFYRQPRPSQPDSSEHYYTLPGDYSYAPLTTHLPSPPNTRQSVLGHPHPDSDFALQHQPRHLGKLLAYGDGLIPRCNLNDNFVYALALAVVMLIAYALKKLLSRVTRRADRGWAQREVWAVEDGSEKNMWPMKVESEEDAENGEMIETGRMVKASGHGNRVIALAASI